VFVVVFDGSVVAVVDASGNLGVFRSTESVGEGRFRDTGHLRVHSISGRVHQS
jgi:hypothetical protein